MSNIFLSTSLITLAEIQLGCQGDEDSCGTIYGFKPSSLIALIATVSGILSSVLLPFVGAIIDYTPNRHLVGVLSSAILVAIQAIQIYTVESTWFPMSILQAINGFIYQVVALASYAYLPEIVSSIDEKTFQWYSSLYYIAMFGHEILFLIVMAAIAVILGTDDVVTAQISQGLDTVVTGGYFILTWYYFTKKEAKAILSKDSTLCGAGFRQVFRTSAGLYHHYPKTVGRFFVGCIFAEAGINSFTTISVTYVNEVLKFNSTQISILFLTVLTCTIPGSYFANWLADKTNPLIAFKLQIITFIMLNFVGFLILNNPTKEMAAYIMGFFWGFWLGWYYPLEKLIYSMIVPKGQESELAGFFLYCSQILTFLPPLVFALMNEAGINLKWGGIHLNIYMSVGLVFFHFMLPWRDCLEVAKVNAMRKNGMEEQYDIMESDYFIE